MTATTRISLAGPVYRAYLELWRRAGARATAWIAEAAPETGGVHLYAHNWYRCLLGTAREKPNTAAVVAAMDRGDTLCCYILDRGAREYDLAEHREHVRDGEVGRYLWCDACQGRPWTGRGWDPCHWGH
jgi:hypothetical protein